MSDSPKKKTIDERSVLAARYVPQELRRINKMTVTMRLPAFKLPALMPDGYSASLVPPAASCYCKVPHPTNSAPIRKIIPEIGFALKPIVSYKNEPPWPTVNGIADLDSYCSTFEKLLWEERSRILYIYEQYSRYNIPMKFVASEDRKTLMAQLFIAGMADARPPLQTGDHVLFRPMKYISLPVHQHDGQVQWSSAHHFVEVEATVLVTRRMDTKLKRKNDQVITSWLDPISSQTLEQAYPSQHYNVRFIPSVKQYERCLSALDWLKTVPPNLARALLFPNEAPILPKLEQKKDYGDLNEKQSMFVDMVRLRTSHPSTDYVRPPMLLTGPAGTGKTKTMLTTILEVLKDGSSLKRKHCILICTPSHTAADVVTTRLGQYLEAKDIFRLYDSDRPVETVPVHMLQYCRQAGRTGAFSLPSARELYAFKVIVCTCSDAHLLYCAGFTNAQLRIRRRCFQTYMERTIVECNLSGGAIGGVDEPHFSHLFIDEAAQATEAETLIPLSVVVDPLPGNAKVEIVLVGDPRQLSPNVFCPKAADCGLDKSFLERLLQRPVNCLGGGHPHMLGPPTLGNLHTMQDWIQYSFQKEGQDYLSVFLTKNYRGHPSFLMMPSTLFYFDKLQSFKQRNGHFSKWLEKLRIVEELSLPVSLEGVLLPAMLQPRKQSSWPIHFRGVIGKDVSVALDSFTGPTNAWSNRAEAEAVLDIISTLSRSGVSSQSIGVMAPFRGQVVVIRKMLREKNFGGINVGTIADYQAVERDVIVLSLTRSNEKFVASDVERRMGLFQQLKRTNVATTRAENLFIVVGNPIIMSKDPIWRQWLWFFLRNGLWYDEDGGKEILDWFSTSRKPFRAVMHRSSIDSAPFMFLSASREERDEDDIVTISSLERQHAPRPLV